MSTPNDKSKAQSESHMRDNLKEIYDVAVVIIGAIGVATTALIAVFSDCVKLGASIAALGLIAIGFWALTTWTRLGFRPSEIDDSVQLVRFSSQLRIWCARVGLLAAIVGSELAGYCYMDLRIPADVYVFDQPLVAADGRFQTISQLRVRAKALEKEYQGVAVWGDKNDGHHEHLIDFAITKRQHDRWEIIDELVTTIDAYQPLPQDLTVIAVTEMQSLREGLTYTVDVLPPTGDLTKQFRAAFVPPYQKARYQRVVINSDIPVNCRIGMRFLKTGIYTFTVRLSLAGPSGKTTLTVVKGRELAVIEPAALDPGPRPAIPDLPKVMPKKVG